MRLVDTVPRFALPLRPGDLAAAVSALVHHRLPDATLFAQPFSDAAAFWCSSGRQALRLLINGLGLSSGSGVALPLFTDLSVVEAVVAAGMRPVFIDVDEGTLTMDPASLAAVGGTFAAVVPVHLFGHVADIPELLSAAGDLPVIEDTAHAPFCTLNGEPVGKFGRACFYSFASTKYWPSGGGGLAVVHDPHLAASMREWEEKAEHQPRREELRNLLALTAKAILFSRPMYGLTSIHLRRWTDSKGLLEPKMNHASITPAQAAIALRQATRMGDRVEQQRANSLRLIALLSDIDGIVLPYERKGCRYNYHIFPVLFRDADERANVAASMLGDGVDTSRIYFNIVNHCRKHGYTSGCPVSESVATRLLTIPNYASLTQQDIERVGRSLRKAVLAHRRARHSCSRADQPAEVAL